jgi:hypothetical protein
MSVKEIKEIYILIAKVSSVLNIVPLLFLYHKGLQRRGLLFHLTWFYFSILCLHICYYLFVNLKDGRPYYTVQHLHIIRNIVFFASIFLSFVQGIKHIEKYIQKGLIVLISFEIINIIWIEGLNYAKWALLFMNFYVIAICCLGLYFYSRELRQGSPNRKSYFIIFVSFLITFLLTIISDFFIPYLFQITQPLYYASFIYANVISIIFEIGFMSYAIYLFRPVMNRFPNKYR